MNRENERRSSQLRRRTLAGLIALAALLPIASPAAAQPYSIPFFTVDGGGHGQISGGAFTIQGTIGQPDASMAVAGGSFSLSGGFWVDAISAATPPTMGALAVSNVTATSATLDGEVTSDGGSVILSRGVVYSKTSLNTDPLIGGADVTTLNATGTTGPFSLVATLLAPQTTYAAKAFASNALGVTYTTISQFTTDELVCPFIGLSFLPGGIVGTPYSASVVAAGGQAPYSYQIADGVLPAGLTLDPATGAIAGVPPSTGVFDFVITATDFYGCEGTEFYSMAIGSTIGAGDLVISEFRFRGPANEPNDEYVTVFNRTNFDLTVAAVDGSGGFGIKRSGGSVATIPNGTVIKAGGSFLAANTPRFSLAVAPDASVVSDIPDDSGIALFASEFNLDPTTRLDAVGFADAPSLYREGAGLAPSSGIAAGGQWAFVRRRAYPSGQTQDTGDNAADFQFLATDAGIYSGRQSALGAPGPSNLAGARPTSLPVELADPTVSANAAPNRAQTGNYHYFRRRITNDTGSAITKLRLRLSDLSTLCGAGYTTPTQADWRGISTPSVPIFVPGAATATGVTLEAPSVPYSATGKGAGYNATFIVDLTAVGGTLANGDSVIVNLGFRNVRGGSFYFLLVPEVLN